MGFNEEKSEECELEFPLLRLKSPDLHNKIPYISPLTKYIHDKNIPNPINFTDQYQFA